jgi:hypothetical protein
MTSKPIPSEEQYRREFRAIFAETDHRTLNALLIVSGSATIAFLSFLGSAFKDGDVAARIGWDSSSPCSSLSLVSPVVCLLTRPRTWVTGPTIFAATRRVSSSWSSRRFSPLYAFRRSCTEATRPLTHSEVR